MNSIKENLSLGINSTIEKIPTFLGKTIPFTNISPVLDIYLISLFLSLYITLINKKFTDQIKIKALREEMKQLRLKHKETMLKDMKKAQKIQQEMMQKNLENLKQTMNPKIMLLTMFPALILFPIIRKYYLPLGEFFNLGFTSFGWLGTYVLFSLINSIILKKILDVA